MTPIKSYPYCFILFFFVSKPKQLPNAYNIIEGQEGPVGPSHPL